jgi:hypothetical protein
MTAPFDLADALNRGCFCQTLDPHRLRAQLEADPTLHGLFQSMAQTHPNLFSPTVVFLAQPMVDAIRDSVHAIERTMALPAWNQHAMAMAAPIAQQAHGPVGVFMGYDFHIAPTGPQLIEINTNAGGALLNSALARAQAACCKSMDVALNSYRNVDTLEDDFFASFQNEWRLQRGDKQPLRTIAIVDDNPTQQYLAPEFALFQHLFAQRGLHAVIADAAALQWREGRLWHEETAIDLVYNRVTDFDLSQPEHAALAQAYQTGDVVLTPHPHAHALRADKRHLITLGSGVPLQALGVPLDDQKTLLTTVPACEAVTHDKADDLWARRRGLFFKPAAGFGARAVYRGDKLTRRVWDEILDGNYIAQAMVPPSYRALEIDDTQTELKFDIRAYTYAGDILLLAARTYSGQTTNFRTQGGGFAPVLTVPRHADASQYREMLEKSGK